jgi:hypothetical protein
MVKMAVRLNLAQSTAAIALLKKRDGGGSA